MPDKRDQKWESILSPASPASTVAAAVKDLAVLSVETHVVGANPEDIILRIETTIEQVTGDIKNTISETAFTTEYGERLLAFHERQRTEATRILERNVAAIRSLIQMIRDLRATN